MKPAPKPLCNKATTGAPDNAFEGLRFLGYPVYERLVLWDLTRPQLRSMS